MIVCETSVVSRMHGNLSRGRPLDPVRFIVVAGIGGAAVPFAVTAVLSSLGGIMDSLPASWTRLFHPIVLLIALFAGLLWPPIGKVFVLLRVGVSRNDLFLHLAGGALLNAVTYAVLGALIWYALYRARWAWLPVAAILLAFWWPFLGDLLFALN
jgi:hypothetical protein